MVALITPTENTDLGKGVADVVASLAAAGDTVIQWYNSGNEICFINNGGMASITATLAARADNFGRGGSTVGDEAITIPAGKLGMFHFAAMQGFNIGSVAQVTLSSSSSVTVGVRRILKQT